LTSRYPLADALPVFACDEEEEGAGEDDSCARGDAGRTPSPDCIDGREEEVEEECGMMGATAADGETLGVRFVPILLLRFVMSPVLLLLLILLLLLL